MVLSLLIVGCTNNKYDEEMKQGKEALELREYVEASLHFEEALEQKSTDQMAVEYLKHTKNMIKANRLLDEGELKKAKNIFSEILNVEEDFVVIKKDAEKQLDVIKDLIKSYDHAKQ